MFSPKAVRRIAIVGTGTIGASWATHYLARRLRCHGHRSGARRRGGVCVPTLRVHGRG